MWVRVPRLPLTIVRPWCNRQHGWFQPSWSGFESLGACLEDGSPARTVRTISGSSSNRRTSASHAGNLGASPSGSTAIDGRSCGPAAKAAPLQGDDRWFESTQDYSMPRYANLAERLGSDPRVCRFDSCSGYLTVSGSVGNRRPLWLRARDAVGSSPT